MKDIGFVARFFFHIFPTGPVNSFEGREIVKISFIFKMLSRANTHHGTVLEDFVIGLVFSNDSDHSVAESSRVCIIIIIIIIAKIWRGAPEHVPWLLLQSFEMYTCKSTWYNTHTVHTMCLFIHVLMRDEKEGRKKQARSNKQQGKAPQHTQGSHFSQEK